MSTTTAPDLWPCMDRSTPTAQAWVDLWDLLHHDTWTPTTEAIDAVLAKNPTVKRDTLMAKMYEAKRLRLIQKRGGYSHKTKRDTRAIRRHPAAQETTAP